MDERCPIQVVSFCDRFSCFVVSDSYDEIRFAVIKAFKHGARSQNRKAHAIARRIIVNETDIRIADLCGEVGNHLSVTACADNYQSIHE